jgi:hypothetical protein
LDRSPPNAYGEHRRSAPVSVTASTPPPSQSWLPTTQELGLVGFGALIVLAAVFYLWWGLFYGVWADNGVYAVVITLLLFGLAGMWLFWPEPPAPTPPSA